MSGQTSETARIEAFSDGVFAIAITLLVLEIRVPEPEAAAHAGSLARALAALWPSYLGYLISFVTIGIMLSFALAFVNVWASLAVHGVLAAFFLVPERR